MDKEKQSFDQSLRDCVKTAPTYIPGRSIESIKKDYGLSSVIKLASNENPLGPAVTTISELSSALHQYYPDVANSSSLQKLADFLEVSKDKLILGNGSDEIIQLLALAFLDPGDEAITSECTFSEYEFAVHLLGGILHTIPMKAHQYDLFAMKQAITDKTKLIFIANPNNPTGTIVSKEDFEAFMSAVPSSVVVVMDEAYYEYVTSAQYPQTIKYLVNYPNLIVLRTFSKVYGLANFRIGYGIGNPSLISALHKVKQPFNVSGVALKAAELALSNVEHLQKSLQVNEEGKQFFYESFDSLGLKYVLTEANFVFVTLPVIAHDVCTSLLEKGIIVRDMVFFDEPYCIRVTIGTMDENKAFIKALKDVLQQESGL
ncbi:histidinol-phosphate transaminase [Candidatus Marinamargulisbacteria bacterium SCGC AG-439-L15]|nr:histidinol-phosphate transaminase [Candidatus Marinamargulisbacteria bacterium SCGC AG-439-L15]